MPTIDDVERIIADLPEVEGSRPRRGQAGRVHHLEVLGRHREDRAVGRCLLQLKAVGARVLHDAIVDGWLASAPAVLADEFVASGGLRNR